MTDKIEIENYRGWTIYFDKETDRFYSVSQSDDVDKTSKTFTAAKKAIDDYLKDNQNFKPFEVMMFSKHRYADFERGIIMGQRKDGRYIIKKEGKEPEQLHQAYESDWIEHKSENDSVVDAIKQELKSFSEYYSDYQIRLQRLRLQMKVKTVKEIRLEQTGKEE